MTIGSSHLVFSDVYNLDSIVRNTAMMAGRNLLVDALREIFRRDREYRYVTDQFGFPKTPSNLGLNGNDGAENELTTRIFIGTSNRQAIAFMPSVTIRPTSTRYFPISFNQNEQTVRHSPAKTVDGYGNQSVTYVPSHYIFAGAWEQSFEIKVMGRSLEDTLSIGDIIMPSLQNTYRTVLKQSGLFIKDISSNGVSEEQIGEADPVYTTSITVNTFSEWRREIPISNLVERIHLCFTMDAVPTDIPAVALGGDMSVS